MDTAKRHVMQTPPSSSPRPDHIGRGIAARIAASLVFALMAAAAKLAAQTGAHPVEVIFYRQFFSLPLIIAWVLIGPGIASLATARPRAHLVRSGLGVVATVAVFLAILWLPLAEATALSFLSPLFATALAALILREHVGIHRWVAIGIAFAGMLVMTRSAGVLEAPIEGLAVALLAALLAACVSITIRQLGVTESPTTTVFWFATIATTLFIIPMPWFFQTHDAYTWGLLIALGLLGGVMQLLAALSLYLAPVGTLAPFDYLQLLWATLIGWLIWADFPDGWTIAGAVLIAGSGLYTFHREHVRRRDIARRAGPMA